MFNVDWFLHGNGLRLSASGSGSAACSSGLLALGNLPTQTIRSSATDGSATSMQQAEALEPRMRSQPALLRPAFRPCENKPNPVRTPLSAKSSTLRHHGTFPSILRFPDPLDHNFFSRSFSQLDRVRIFRRPAPARPWSERHLHRLAHFNHGLLGAHCGSP